MPTKKERLDALEADMRELREELDLVNERLNERTNGLGAKLSELTAAFTLHNNAMVDSQAALDRQMADLRLVIEDHNRRISDNKNLDEINRQLAESFRRIHARLSALESTTVGSTIFGLQPNPPGFPTGAATTVDDALAAVPAADDGPPQRGDRVRIEGSPRVADGWYDVVGHDDDGFQIRHGVTPGHVSLFMWLPGLPSSLKEIRRNAARPEVDDKDLDV